MYVFLQLYRLIIYVCFWNCINCHIELNFYNTGTMILTTPDESRWKFSTPGCLMVRPAFESRSVSKLTFRFNHMFMFLFLYMGFTSVEEESDGQEKDQLLQSDLSPLRCYQCKAQVTVFFSGQINPSFLLCHLPDQTISYRSSPNERE